MAPELLGVHRAGVEAMTAPAPRPLRLAVTLMLVAAVASLGQAVLALVMADRIRSLALLGAVRNSVTGPFLAASAAEFTIVAAVVTGLAGAGLWAWLAVSAGRRRTWVRVAATVLAGLTVLVLVASFVIMIITVVHVAAAAATVAAVVATVLLHQRGVVPGVDAGRA
ncbi:MAG TPA: hypothetical protein VK103_01370 [Bacillota bacterium]|nr:hypothetical protein [Bacillota bacterium]